MLSPRLKRIKRRLFEEEFLDPGVWYFKDTNIVTDENRHESILVRKGMAQRHIGKNLPAYVKNDELIVGNPNMNSVGFGSVLPIYATDEENEKAKEYKMNEKSIWGHHPPRWQKVLEVGFEGIIEEINAKLGEQLDSEHPDAEAIDEYRAMLIAIEGVLDFAKRHADVALEMSLAEEDPTRKKELFEIYKVCTKVPFLPAETFHEALQSYWFTYCMVNSGGEFVPLGRTDQIVYPYYERDIREGLITEDEAVDLIGSFLAKCNERICTDTKIWENHYDFGLFSQGVPPTFGSSLEESGGSEAGGYDIRALSWQDNEDHNSQANFNFGQSANDWLMNMIVGGLRPDGEDGTTQVTSEMVRLRFEMDLLMPTLSARVSSKTPEWFWKQLAECLKKNDGEPAIYNDDAIIPGFVEMGVPLEDARDYSNDGCWECLVPGKSYFSYTHIMNTRCLEWVFTEGKTLLSGEKEGLDLGPVTAYKTYDEFYEAYCKQVNNQIDLEVEKRMENLGISKMIAPDPLISTIFDGCIEKGRDMTGANVVPYTDHLLLVTGLSNLVDSLAAIKKLVFEDQEYTLEDFKNAIENDWVGYDELALKVKNRVPKYGNDDDYVDNILIDVLRDFEDYAVTWRDKQDMMMLPVGIGTFENYGALGRNLSATADGRRSGEALAPNYSPTSGVDVEGTTAVIKSATKPNLLRYFCGCPLDVALNANDFQGEVGTARMEGILRSFCTLGGQIGTFTTTSVEELEDARVNPQNHKDLKVRMGGLSAYFIAMAPAQQENVIQRFSR